ncbi:MULTISPECIES: DUF4031 domain-containing protein [Mycobacterium]|uniref:DUF4031 domain-containing protein n=1 Tax=Mycobacterium TaxID=1763 RepID=UPI0009661D91|nr:MULTISPECIES: DUF4031 domain-containing protein [Mycobacterium]MCG7606808.1 DUF4031 domain-containing protein [Mycobacterium sp. CnD-18-1]OLT98196.1 hypothetical protein BKG60_01800 [Mycobacterium syngnathidarum]
MTVYVDDMRMLATIGRLDARWSHLTADTEEELHEFAARLGLSRRTAQFPGTWKSHYDVTDFTRDRAMELGAVAIGYRSTEAVALLRRKRALQPPSVQLALPLELSSQRPDTRLGTASMR